MVDLESVLDTIVHYEKAYLSLPIDLREVLADILFTDVPYERGDVTIGPLAWREPLDTCCYGCIDQVSLCCVAGILIDDDEG